MKKIIITAFICLTTIIISAQTTYKQETAKIIGLTVKRIKGVSKSYSLDYGRGENTKQIITITYKGKNKINKKFIFQIIKRKGSEIQAYTYYMKDEDKINFEYYNFRLIVFKDFFWFKNSN